MFTTALQYQQHYGYSARYELLQPLEFNNGKHRVHIPAGFITDLSTWYPEGRHTPASIVHDFILDSTGRWDVANKLMMDVLDDPQLNVRWWNKTLIKTGISIARVWHYLAHSESWI